MFKREIGVALLLLPACLIRAETLQVVDPLDSFDEAIVCSEFEALGSSSLEGGSRDLGQEWREYVQDLGLAGDTIDHAQSTFKIMGSLSPEAYRLRVLLFDEDDLAAVVDPAGEYTFSSEFGQSGEEVVYTITYSSPEAWRVSGRLEHTGLQLVDCESDKPLMRLLLVLGFPVIVQDGQDPCEAMMHWLSRFEPLLMGQSEVDSDALRRTMEFFLTKTAFERLLDRSETLSTGRDRRQASVYFLTVDFLNSREGSFDYERLLDAEVAMFLEQLKKDPANHSNQEILELLSAFVDAKAMLRLKDEERHPRFAK